MHSLCNLDKLSLLLHFRVPMPFSWPKLSIGIYIPYYGQEDKMFALSSVIKCPGQCKYPLLVNYNSIRKPVQESVKKISRMFWQPGVFDPMHSPLNSPTGNTPPTTTTPKRNLLYPLRHERKNVFRWVMGTAARGLQNGCHCWYFSGSPKICMEKDVWNLKGRTSKVQGSEVYYLFHSSENMLQS